MVNSLTENRMNLPATPQAELEVSRLIASIFINLDESDRQLTKRFGLTVTQYWALFHLEHPEGRSLGELAALLICDKSNVTSVVDKLEAAGLAERQRGKAGDRRYTRVVLTQHGQQLRQHVKAARTHIIITRLQPLGQEALGRFWQMLQQVDTLLKAQFISGDVPALIAQALAQQQISS
jgi:DNA-binding MarR family transcriptional regulator